MSREYLRSHPVCEICRSAPSTQLDHIKPRSLADGVRALCGPCHRDHGLRADGRIAPRTQRRAPGA